MNNFIIFLEYKSIRRSYGNVKNINQNIKIYELCESIHHILNLCKLQIIQDEPKTDLSELIS